MPPPELRKGFETNAVFNRQSLSSGAFFFKGNAAFSLIEIVMALGIVAFCLIPVVGLMPIGLTTLRETIDTAVSAQIAQVIVNEAQQSDFNSLQASQDFSFDEQGNLLKESTDSLKLYEVHLQVTKTTPIPSGTLGVTSSDLATFTITITQSFTKAKRTLSALVARSSS